MDLSANPAHDFYRFAAGGWVDQTVIPDTEGQVNGFIGEEFEAFTNKLVAQYDRYEALPGVPINGKLPVTENTADLGGVTLALHALQQALAEQAVPPDPIGGYSRGHRLRWCRETIASEVISFIQERRST
jgi:predicted metalloendopeptidase